MIITLVLLQLAILTGVAQDTTIVAPRSISLSEITGEVTSINQTLVEKQSFLISDLRKEEITSDIESKLKQALEAYDEEFKDTV